MRESDARGRLLAIVSHELMNAHLSDDAASVAALAALEELGYGLMSLPPAAQPESLWLEAFDHLVDQLQDYLRHDYAVIVVADRHVADWMERLDTACRARNVTPPQRIRVAPDFRDALTAVGGSAP